MNWKNRRALAAALIGAALLSGCMDDDWWVVVWSSNEKICVPEQSPDAAIRRATKDNFGMSIGIDTESPWKNGHRIDLITDGALQYGTGKLSVNKSSFYATKDECESDKNNAHTLWLGHGKG